MSAPKIVGAPRDIPGAPFNPYVEIAARYAYDDKDGRTRCPACGGSGIPWAGWFSCDSDFTGNGCYCVALVSDGRAFIPDPSVNRGLAP